MKKLLGISLIVVCLVLSGTAMAVETTLTLEAPLAGDSTIVTGVPGESAPGWGTGSWQSNGTGTIDVLYVSPIDLFGHSVTIGDLASISYWTMKDSTHADDAADWFFKMYTMPYEGSPGSNWYGNRINSEPYFSDNINDPANTWNQWTTGAGEDNRLRFFDSSSGYFGSYSDGFLSDLTSDSDYSGQEIKYLGIATGSAWATGFTGYLDGLSIKLTNDDVGNINFEAVAAVPVPGAFLLGGIGVSFVGWMKRRRSL